MNTTISEQNWLEDREEAEILPESYPMAQSIKTDSNPFIQCVIERYRCPETFLNFRLGEELSARPSYFQFGGGTTCYGRLPVPRAQAKLLTDLHDAASTVLFDDSQVVLPFDPNEIVDNLRLERYPTGRLRAHEKALKGFYYRLRPFTGRTLRKFAQKLRAANWQKRRFPQWPVDTTVENICENLLVLALQASGVERIPFIWFWPDGAPGCVAMTHDVETAEGRDFCESLLDIDDAHGIKASFQIVPEDRYPVTAAFLNNLRNRGAEVCVQDLNHDGRLFDRRMEFLHRVSRINRYGREYGAKGFRSAVLYRRPGWYADLDFSFDMSIPNVARFDPQRGGCCTVLPYFIGTVLELPLTTIQDYTLWHVLEKRSIELWKIQFEMILARNGLATFLVHPDYITESTTQRSYRDLLSMLNEFREQYSPWFALPGEIDTWWRTRDRMRIVRDGEGWRIVGNGADRAVLAFAKLSGGKLVYEFSGDRRRNDAI